MSRLSVRAVPALALAALIAGAAAWANAADDDGFKPIFNGKDLDGWEGSRALWSVKDGAITGIVTADKPLKYNQFLIYSAAKPRDFHLKARVKLVGNSNSGIQYR